MSFRIPSDPLQWRVFLPIGLAMPWIVFERVVQCLRLCRAMERVLSWRRKDHSILSWNKNVIWVHPRQLQSKSTRRCHRNPTDPSCFRDSSGCHFDHCHYNHNSLQMDHSSCLHSNNNCLALELLQYPLATAMVDTLPSHYCW